jgi:hypothetical protein
MKGWRCDVGLHAKHIKVALENPFPSSMLPEQNLRMTVFIHMYYRSFIATGQRHCVFLVVGLEGCLNPHSVFFLHRVVVSASG